MFSSHRHGITGILLAAGRGERFDPVGVQDKLLQRLPDGNIVAVASASRLRVVLAKVVAVVRPECSALRALLEGLGCDVIACDAADQGMAVSLVHGIRHAQDAEGWLIALADMPFISSQSIMALVDAIGSGADIAAPVYHGRRGNPVAFSRRHRNELLQLHGDRGARSLLKMHPVAEVDVEDPGILRDIDTPADLFFDGTGQNRV